MRRALPLGGTLKEDYVLTEGSADLQIEGNERQTTFSELFAPGKDTLAVYSFMLTPGGNACPACTSLIDGLDGMAPHIQDKMNFAVFAKAPISEFRTWGRTRAGRTSACFRPVPRPTMPTTTPKPTNSRKPPPSTSSTRQMRGFSTPGGRRCFSHLPPTACIPVTWTRSGRCGTCSTSHRTGVGPTGSPVIHRIEQTSGIKRGGQRRSPPAPEYCSKNSA